LNHSKTDKPERRNRKKHEEEKRRRNNLGDAEDSLLSINMREEKKKIAKRACGHRKPEKVQLSSYFESLGKTECNRQPPRKRKKKTGGKLQRRRGRYRIP